MHPTFNQTAGTMPDSPIRPPHEIRTEQLILRSARAGDGPGLHDAIRVSLNEFFPWLSFSAQLPDLETLERVSSIGFSFEGIARNNDGDAAGDLCSTTIYALLKNSQH